MAQDNTAKIEDVARNLLNSGLAQSRTSALEMAENIVNRSSRQVQRLNENRERFLGLDKKAKEKESAFILTDDDYKDTTDLNAKQILGESSIINTSEENPVDFINRSTPISSFINKDPKKEFIPDLVPQFNENNISNKTNVNNIPNLSNNNLNNNSQIINNSNNPIFDNAEYLLNEALNNEEINTSNPITNNTTTNYLPIENIEETSEPLQSNTSFNQNIEDNNFAENLINNLESEDIEYENLDNEPITEIEYDDDLVNNLKRIGLK